jgi:regulation of enolase protein 1 (concanavalin A-like superfamily)
VSTHLQGRSPIPKLIRMPRLAAIGGQRAWPQTWVPILVLAVLASIVTVGGRVHSPTHGARSGLEMRPPGNARIARGSLWASTLASCSASTPLERASAIDLVQTVENSSIASDDFNVCTLDSNVWTYTDPVGDGTYSMTGTFTQDARLSISVPGGSSHNIWDDGNDSSRVMQATSDTDFEIEVKFDSGLSQKYQIQGILIQQDEDRFLRLDFHNDGVGTRLYAAAFEPNSSPGSPLTHTLMHVDTIAGSDVAPLYMRVRRQGDEWTLRYSFDGASWTDAVTFDHALVVTEVGVFSGNAGSALPAHTAHIDYFFKTTSPIDPEDGARATLTVEIDGGGTVSVVPEKPSYDCDEVVTLSAEPADWFESWSGDLSGTDNPATLTMAGSRSVAASFSLKPETYLPLAMTPAFSNYLFVGDFEVGDLTGFFWNQNKPQVVGPPRPVRAGNRSARCYLHRYQSEYSYRTMVIVGADDSNPEGTRDPLVYEIGQEYWMGFSIYVPDDFVVDLEGLTDILMQVQATPDAGEDYRSPIYDIAINADSWSIMKRWDTRVKTPPGNTFSGTQLLYRSPLGESIGDWTDWVLQVKWSWRSNGFIRVWRDGVQVVDDAGPNCSNDQVGPYTSLGVYKWPWRPEHSYPSNTDERLIYIDELRIAGADADYDAVAP